MVGILYSQIYWQSLNLTVWPQIRCKKLNLAVARQGLAAYYIIINIVRVCIRERCHASSHLTYLNKAVSSQIYNWLFASANLAISIDCIERHGAGPRVLLHALRHYALRVKIILADFNLAVSTPTAKPPNLIPRQIFRLYSM